MWMQLVVSLIMMVISTAIQSMSQPEQKDPEVGKLDIPTADEGGPIPVIFGTCMTKQSNVVWYGDASTEPIMSSGGGKK